MNPKNNRSTVGLLFGTLVLGGALAAGSQTNFFGLIGPQPDGTGLTPNHWTLAPAGLSVEIGDRPMGTATSPDGHYIAVSNDGQGVQSLALFDTATRKVVQRIPYSSPESLYLGVAWSPDGKTLYASAGGNNKVRVYSFDGSQLSEGAPIVLNDASAPSYPAGLAVSPDGKTLYAALNLGNAVVAIDTGSRAATSLKTLRFGDASKPADIGTLPYALLLSPDGKTLYVSHWNARAVSLIDTATLKLTAQVKVGDHPTGLALAPDGATLYVANANSDTVSAVDTKGARVLAS